VNLAQNQQQLTLVAGVLSSLWGLAHLGMGYMLGFIASTFVRPRIAFVSAGFLIDGILILVFSVAMLAGWSGSNLMGVMAYGLSAILGVGLIRIASPPWGAPFVAIGFIIVLYLLVKSIRTDGYLAASFRRWWGTDDGRQSWGPT
jgi:hypothetical protein